jgi:hypothetical protein
MAVQLVDAPQAIEQVTRGEVEIQALLAMRNPRDQRASLRRTLAEATADQDVAGDCFYVIRRGTKLIEGPSVRLCEIAARHWGNLRCGSRVVDVGDTLVTSQGYAWDLETNYVVYQERQRRITTKEGSRFNDDMIVTTANAAASIAFREAVTKTIGKTQLDKIWRECKRVSVGETMSMGDRWQKWVGFMAKASVDEPQILKALGRSSVADIVPEDLVTLQGFVTSIRDGEAKVEDVFPPLEDPETAVPRAGSSSFGGKQPAPAPRETPSPAPDSYGSAGDERPPEQDHDYGPPPMGEGEAPEVTAEEAEAAGQQKLGGAGF